ncbi:MAG: SDR family oxidoreductase [Deltaproteobacteria bacterium]|nr:SDR family oxidoreductase [Deltaproteobacteria bacterium]MBW1817023.1 SDR family oxidoreductase [Deltaproteobacteria bacterium]MBW2283796.1 SDR family oxidoreductase [Deltaproteobacteria bacterium]
MKNDVFKDRVALITGSSRGIGRVIALKFAESGAHVVINHRRDDEHTDVRVQHVCEAVRRSGRHALAVRADISDKSAVKGMIRAATEQFGRLDFLVLNAARAPFKPFERILERDLRQLVDTNFLGHVFCIQAALPLLKENGGKIVFISSLGSRFYNASYPLGSMKAAMEAVVRDCAEELRPFGISVNGVCGGLVKTDSLKVIRQHAENHDAVPEYLLMDPEEIADVVRFLCSDAGRAIHGQTLIVDRGLSNRLGGW